MRRATETGSPGKRFEFGRGTSRLVANEPFSRPVHKHVSPRKPRLKLTSPRPVKPSSDNSLTSAMNSTLNSLHSTSLSSFNANFNQTEDPSNDTTPTRHTNTTDDGWLDIDEAPKTDTSASTSFFAFSPSMSTTFMRRVQESRLQHTKQASQETEVFKASINANTRIGSLDLPKPSSSSRPSSSLATPSGPTLTDRAAQTLDGKIPPSGNNYAGTQSPIKPVTKLSSSKKLSKQEKIEQPKKTDPIVGSTGSPKRRSQPFKRGIDAIKSLRTSFDSKKKKTEKLDLEVKQEFIPPTEKRPVWSDPATPALIAMYVQVAYNAMMVILLLYAISVFYITIRNDVNMKVEEYSVDIVNEIAHCSYEYVRNGCEPSKRVPAIEAACRQWERCMQRVPEEVGRARVSAETFGAIIESFLKPIGIKSMIFLVSVFAGSFLLINSVFASRIGPRFAYTDNSHNPHQNPPSNPTNNPNNPGQPQPQPTPQHASAHPTPVHNMPFHVSQPPTPLPNAYGYAQNPYMFTPSQASPRQPIIQSSPIQRQFYPY